MLGIDFQMQPARESSLVRAACDDKHTGTYACALFDSSMVELFRDELCPTDKFVDRH